MWKFRQLAFYISVCLIYRFLNYTLLFSNVNPVYNTRWLYQIALLSSGVWRWLQRSRRGGVYSASRGHLQNWKPWQSLQKKRIKTKIRECEYLASFKTPNFRKQNILNVHWETIGNSLLFVAHFAIMNTKSATAAILIWQKQMGHHNEAPRYYKLEF